MSLIDEAREAIARRNLERCSELLARFIEHEPDIEDYESATTLLRFAESLAPDATPIAGCSVDAGQLCEIVACALFWHGYWNSPPTHVHKEIQAELSRLQAKSAEFRSEVERLESENAALRLRHNDPREATIESPEGSR